MISLIVAHSENNVIGFNNQMPWHLPGELAYFKKMTMGKPMIMGRKTFESIGRPLPGRRNIIITRDQSYKHEGIEVFHSLEDALESTNVESQEVMIIGGEQIFKLVLPIADRLYITKIQKSYEGDTFFPSYEKEWKLTSESEPIVTEDGTRFTYFVYDRT